MPQDINNRPEHPVGELASAIARQPGADPLGAGELVSSGTLTESQFIAPGESWTAAGYLFGKKRPVRIMYAR